MKIGLTTVAKKMIGSTPIQKVLIGTTLLWQNIVLIVANVHTMVVGNAVRFNIDVYSATTPIVKNPSVFISMGGRNGSGEVSDYRDFYVYAKRVVDNAWVQIYYTRHNNDVENSTDSVSTTITLSDNVQYNQFRCVMSGFGQNQYWCDSRVTQYWA